MGLEGLLMLLKVFNAKMVRMSQQIAIGQIRGGMTHDSLWGLKGILMLKVFKS